MTSPCSTDVVQSARTWIVPYHFDTSLISIIGMALGPYRMMAIFCCSRLTSSDSPKLMMK